MKKFIIPALASALIIGGVSTTSAANNPFSDVNEHHWAYQSVVELAEAGIITGYDNSDIGLNEKFLGGRSITRYEMAQMIAKALARIEGESSPFNIQLQGHQWTFVDNSGVRRVVDGTVLPFKLSNGAVVDRRKLDEIMNLLIEFRGELDTLGIRVKDLEDHSDLVQWTGELRYRYWHNKTHNQDTTTRSQLQFRLFPTAKLSDHWTAKARLTASVDMKDDTTSDVKMTFVYAEGNFGKFNVKLGKMPLFSDADGGLVVDEFFSGGQITYGDKFKARLEAGKWDLNNSSLEIDDSADYYGAELLYDDDERFNFGAGYRYFKSDDFATAARYGDENKASIVSVGAGYKFGDFELLGAYAKNTKADDFNKGYNIELDYAGADRNEPGSWGLYVGYRYAGDNVSLSPTFDEYEMLSNKKGVTFGATWSPMKNTYTEANYFHGKTLDTNDTSKTFFGRVSFFF